MENWLSEGRTLVELYLVLFSLLSQGVLVGSTLLALIGKLVPELGASLAIGVGVMASVAVVVLADRLELLFLGLLRLSRAAELAGWRRVSMLLRRLLGLLVASSYVPLQTDNDASWMRRLHRAFLTVYSSDAHYPRPHRLRPDYRPAR